MTKMRFKMYVVGCAVSFIAVFVLTVAVLPKLPIRPGDYPRIQRTPDLSHTGRNSFFDTSGTRALGHIVLYHCLGPSIGEARQADVLLFGNSRMQFGMDEEIITAGAAALDIRVFNLAVGHADKSRFALDLIRRHDLRPKIMVVGGGPHLFTEGRSDWAEIVTTMSAWDARRTVFEDTLSWYWTSRLHSHLPKLDYFGDRLFSRNILYRSETTGWWQFAHRGKGRYPIRLAKERANYAKTLRLAEELHQELTSRGTLLVLTMVPYASTRSGHLAYLARELAVPMVLPGFDGLQTGDGSHLNEESARRFSIEFWDEFSKLPEVIERLQHP